MPNYSIGTFIKHRRTELGISQSELCRGVCNVGTLSRIEKGELQPKSDVANLLLERLGYSDNIFDCFMTEKDFRADKAKQLAKNYSSIGKKAEARAIIEDLSRDYESLSLQNKQYCDRVETVYLCSNGVITYEQAVKNLISIFERSSGRFSLDELPTAVSFEEMCLLNNIAICYAHIGRIDIAIKIYYHMKDINENYIVDLFEAIKSRPGIYYNLSKYLGQSGRYDESIAICERSIELLKRTGCYKVLPQTMYNLGWSLVKRGREEDKEKALKILEDACRLSRILSGDSKRTRNIGKFIAENFNKQD